jgi:hypothetical protein
MPQPPFLIDVLQVEPGSGDTLTVSRDSAGGALKFVDALLTSGVLLPSLVGLRNVTGVYIVGRAGDGAPYTTIQSALDAVPDSSSAAAPSLVLIMPGVYTENVSVQKDGVYLVSLGGVTVTNNGASDTVKISAAIATTPQDVLLRGIKIQNTSAAQSCVRITGADSFASGTVTVNAAPLATGDTITINGTALTGTAGTRTSGSDDFSVSSGTTDGIAAEIVAAINDTANSFSTLVSAEAALNVVTLTAVTAGSGGNAITLAVSTTPPGNMTPSGANLTGGGAAGSLVGDGVITIEGCDLVAAGAAGFQVRADTSGHIRVRGGTWRGSDNASLSTASNCALFSVAGVEWANDIEVAYDTTADRPNDTTCEYLISDLSRAGGVLSNLSGAGTLTVSNCPSMTSLNQTGDQALAVKHSSVGALTLGGTTAAVLTASTRSAVTVSAGTPTLSEAKITDSATFGPPDASVQAYLFTVSQPDTNYTVLLESPTTATVLAVANKTVTGFDVEASVAFSGTVSLSIFRNL